MSRSTFSVLFYVNRGKEKGGTARLSVSGGYHSIVPVMGRVTINCTQSQTTNDIVDINGDKWIVSHRHI